LIRLILKDGYAYNPETMVVSMEPFKYFHNLIQMPIILLLFLVGVLAVLWGIISSLIKDQTHGIWWTGGETISVVFALLLIAGYNNTCYYPSNYDLQSSLNIVNSSSSKYTLATMGYVSLAVPFVVAYIWYAWKEINKKKITESEMTDKTKGLIY
jgi:cytochrome d ubiquinol oxidase subunit II